MHDKTSSYGARYDHSNERNSYDMLNITNTSLLKVSRLAHYLSALPESGHLSSLYHSAISNDILMEMNSSNEAGKSENKTENSSDVEL